MVWLGLCENESIKLLRRRRPQLVIALLTVFLAISVWAQHRQRDNALRNRGQGRADWRAVVEGRMHEAERRAQQRRIFVGFNRFQRFEAARLRYHLEHDIDPDAMTGPLFSRAFAVAASSLLLPLLVTVLCADLVSSEVSSGTIKMLLTRPVSRARVFTAKLATMAIYTTLLVAASALLSWAIGGIAFGWRGFSAPMLTGFRSSADGVDLSQVRAAPLWLDALAAWGLAWYAALVVGTIATTFSVLLRSTAAAMGTFIALLAGGMLLGQMASDFELAKWFFVTNLPLAQFYSGLPPPVVGMTLGHAAAVLAVWALAAATVGQAVFSRRDVTA